MRIGIAVDHDGCELTVQLIAALRPPVVRWPHFVPYERYGRQGRREDHVVQDWLLAQREIRKQWEGRPKAVPTSFWAA
jgi:hypothetical protein